mmetsp:Transcript_26787/g.67310  ORF Transcript_26787/g.67310 Transcript_26787/m.67310 type:complete len:360 (-) Transcript_26787:419-1498(-)
MEHEQRAVQRAANHAVAHLHQPAPNVQVALRLDLPHRLVRARVPHDDGVVRAARPHRVQNGAQAHHLARVCHQLLQLVDVVAVLAPHGNIVVRRGPQRAAHGEHGVNHALVRLEPAQQAAVGEHDDQPLERAHPDEVVVLVHAVDHHVGPALDLLGVDLHRVPLLRVVQQHGAQSLPLRAPHPDHGLVGRGSHDGVHLGLHQQHALDHHALAVRAPLVQQPPRARFPRAHVPVLPAAPQRGPTVYRQDLVHAPRVALHHLQHLEVLVQAEDAAVAAPHPQLARAEQHGDDALLVHQLLAHEHGRLVLLPLRLGTVEDGPARLVAGRGGRVLAKRVLGWLNAHEEAQLRVHRVQRHAVIH